MTLDSLVRKVDLIIMKADKNTLKLFVVSVHLVFGGGMGMYYVIDYASKGEYGKATVAGICALTNAYYTGYQYKNIDSNNYSPHQ